jgi:hypothetical protein
MNAEFAKASWILGLLGAAAGGFLGYCAFFWMARQGFYALVLPGAALGLGCGLLARGKSYGLAIVCGVLALLLGLVTEWRFAPFAADGSLPFFLAHLGDLRPFTLMAIVAGGIAAFWFGGGRGKAPGSRGRAATPGENRGGTARGE